MKYLICFLLAGCVAVNSPLPYKHAKLSWEKDASRIEWSNYLFSKLSSDYKEAFLKATDGKRLCQKYDTLSLDQKIDVWAEMISSMAYYESSWNEKSASVDVGKQSQKNTWSIGLLQISVIDQQWSGGNLKYSYNELLTAKPNLHLAMQIMARQIEKTGLFILPNSSKYRYWAVFLDGNKYSKVGQITKQVNALPFCN
jgi:Transglycosylase SLT domain